MALALVTASLDQRVGCPTCGDGGANEPVCASCRSVFDGTKDAESVTEGRTTDPVQMMRQANRPGACLCGFCNTQYGQSMWVCGRCGEGTALPSCSDPPNQVNFEQGCHACRAHHTLFIADVATKPTRGGLIPPDLPNAECPRPQLGYLSWAAVRGDRSGSEQLGLVVRINSSTRR